MVWIWVPEFLTWDKFRLSEKTECIECKRPSVFSEMQSGLILFDNVLRYRVQPDRADNKKRWNSLKTEIDVNLPIKVCFNSEVIKDEFRVRYYLGPPKVCSEPHLSRNSIFPWASSVLIGVKNVVGNIPQPTSGICCLGVSLFPLLVFFLLTQKLSRKWMEC